MDYLLIAAVFAVIYLVSVVASKSIDTMFAAIDAERKPAGKR
jgi:hypothetical protein